MNRSIAIGAGITALVIAVVLYLSAFTVSMTQQAIVLQFGDPRQVITEPGLHWKLPVIQNVVYIDKRILNLDSPAEEIIAKDRKRLVVDAFARYRIVDSLRFYQSVGDPRNVTQRLQPNFISSLRNVLGDHTLEELVRANRAGLMKNIQTAFNLATQQFGIAAHHADIDQCRHGHPGNGRENRQSPRLGGRQLSFDPFALHFEPDDEEEHRHQTVVDPQVKIVKLRDRRPRQFAVEQLFVFARERGVGCQHGRRRNEDEQDASRRIAHEERADGGKNEAES